MAIGEIAAEVAHELRTELQIISATVYLAKLAPPSSDSSAAKQEHLGKIERHARIAHSIVDDLMALARGEPAHAEPILLVECLVRARESLPEPGAVFDDHLDPHDIRVRAHQGLLSRLIHALYENAMDATSPARATIRTTARIEGQRVVVDVSDDGPGVPEAVRDTLFDPLVTARIGGTGFGLALARRVAAAHGGSIELVRGLSNGGGALFRVDLPA